ncbi:MAG: ftsW [Rickettsiaceae bacterium]|jgi:cell division protein FtsW|nr:ftsW [Rickettsiaceae bacterium]
MKFDRQNKNILTTWWWTVDKFSLVAILMIIAFGAMMVATASPAVAERIGYDSFYFVKRQLIFLFIALFTIISISFLSPQNIKRTAAIGFIIGAILMVGVLLFGASTNGAKRWIFIGGMSLQPSEFMKPFFIVVTAWMLSEAKVKDGFKGFQISIVLYGLLAALLISQPDMGMFVVVTAVWSGQLFLAGMPIFWLAVLGIAGIVILIMAYLFFPHVSKRVDSFLGGGNSTTNYQVERSLEAFDSGGMFGRGPGEGVVKQRLPDSHTDFIFAVIGEELGAVICIFIVWLYGFVVLRGFKLMLGETDLFFVYSVSGLLMQFGAQAIINMGVSMNLLPTKGMTLPFVSYGGSSMLAIAVAMGMLLALTKKRFGYVVKKPKLVWEG